MTLEKLCLKIEDFKPGMKRKDIYILLFEFLAVMLMLGVFVCIAITSVTEMLALLVGGVIVVFGLTVVTLIGITETEEMFDIFQKYMRLWWVAVLVEVALSIVIKLFV